MARRQRAHIPPVHDEILGVLCVYVVDLQRLVENPVVWIDLCISCGQSTCGVLVFAFARSAVLVLVSG